MIDSTRDKPATNSWWRLTLIEILVILLIVIVLVALLLPQVQYAASGSIDVSVKILVFDAATLRPIAGAKVGLFRAGPWIGDSLLTDERLTVPLDGVDGRVLPDHAGQTDANGIAIVPYRFETASSSANPVPRALTNFAWLLVEADGYGSALVPVDRRSTPTADLKPHKEIHLPVGLVAPRAI